MSGPGPPSSEPPHPPGTDGPGSALTTSLVIVGILLMLPGACSLVFMLGGRLRLPGIGALWTITFVLAAAGIALIAGAVIRHR